MAKRRRVGVQWAPTLIPTGPGGEDNSFLLFDQSLVAEAGHVISVFPLTFDFPNDPSTATVATHSMADFIGSAYILQRIVGKVFAHEINPIMGVARSAVVMIAAGFFVARADSTNAAMPAATLDAIDPLASANQMEPWIWRRSWMLRNASDLTGVIAPPNIANYGSVMDGPHIDSRVKRRVNDDDRLYFVASAAQLDDVTTGDPVIIRWVLDYRLLVTLRKNKNQSAF